MKLTISPLLLLPLPLAIAAISPAPACPAKNATIPALDPITQSWVDARSNSTPISQLTIPEARIAYDLMAGNVSNPPSADEITTEILHLPVGPTGNVTVYLYKPGSGYREEEDKDLLPVVVYFHGL